MKTKGSLEAAVPRSGLEPREPESAVPNPGLDKGVW